MLKLGGIIAAPFNESSKCKESSLIITIARALSHRRGVALKWHCIWRNENFLAKSSINQHQKQRKKSARQMPAPISIFTWPVNNVSVNRSNKQSYGSTVCFVALENLMLAQPNQPRERLNGFSKLMHFIWGRAVNVGLNKRSESTRRPYEGVKPGVLYINQ